MALDRETLLTPRATTPHGQQEDDVEVPGVGTVRVRGLNRIEAMGIQAIGDTVERERHMLACALVDPEITLDDAETWQRVSSGGELEPVTLRIAELSRMMPASPKGDGSPVRRRSRR